MIGSPPLRHGAMFAGYGGLDMGVQSVIGGSTTWLAEVAPAPSRILAHRFPGVPNLGDVTAVDWRSVEPVDVITGGSPCQDVSSAGKRAGMKPGTRSGLWASMCDAVDIIRPGLVVWENVRGALSAEANSAMEPCPGCVGDGRDGPALRALGRVLGDLADLGYDACWYGLRAADVGAPHGRFRVFVFAALQDADGAARSERWSSAPKQAQGGWARTDARGRGYAPPADADRGGLNGLGWVHPGKRDADGRDRAPGHRQAVEPSPWGPYADAIARWERVLGRSAPAPTEPAPRGGQRLSPRFTEWLMGLPDGWVTDVPGLSRAEQLTALGNGVVPQQAAAATNAWISGRGPHMTGNRQ